MDKCLSSYKLLELPGLGGPAEPSKEPSEDDDPAKAGLKLAGKAQDLQFGLDINTQLGGTYVVSRGGRVIMEHLQKGVGDYVENSFILQALGISEAAQPH